MPPRRIDQEDCLPDMLVRCMWFPSSTHCDDLPVDVLLIRTLGIEGQYSTFLLYVARRLWEELWVNIQAVQSSEDCHCAVRRLHQQVREGSGTWRTRPGPVVFMRFVDYSSKFPLQDHSSVCSRTPGSWAFRKMFALIRFRSRII